MDRVVVQYITSVSGSECAAMTRQQQQSIHSLQIQTVEG